MTTECMSPLRRRMIEDMTIRGHGEKTKLDYPLPPDAVWPGDADEVVWRCGQGLRS